MLVKIPVLPVMKVSRSDSNDTKPYFNIKMPKLSSTHYDSRIEIKSLKLRNYAYVAMKYSVIIDQRWRQSIRNTMLVMASTTIICTALHGYRYNTIQYNRTHTVTPGHSNHPWRPFEYDDVGPGVYPVEQ